MTTPTPRPPGPPFDEISATLKVRAAADRRIFGARADGDTTGIPLQ